MKVCMIIDCCFGKNKFDFRVDAVHNGCLLGIFRLWCTTLFITSTQHVCF